jgi:hypothetical protein
MDTQVAAGRVEDARWLLENFGSTNSVLELEHLEADNFVYAGTLIVHGDVRVPASCWWAAACRRAAAYAPASSKRAKRFNAAAPSCR